VKEYTSVEPHPASLSDAALLKDCEVVFGRVGGPGGQHRNNVATAASLEHLPTGIIGQASERRHQAQNRHVALKRLRLKLARKIRRPIDPRRYRPSALWTERRQGDKLPVSATSRDYPAMLAEAMDVVVAMHYDVAGAAGRLGVTMSQLARLIRHDRAAFAQVNEARESRGLPRLK
jgi:hypothetical protein